ncbi:hypothetical protein AB1L30_13875 [Bremerella sp. JC817]|uniref:hypothetical protein n=1 Tax=Bremerella sp. JC817 TaxID=3231756 RepID=UPI0034574AE8
MNTTDFYGDADRCFDMQDYSGAVAFLRRAMMSSEPSLESVAKYSSVAQEERIAFIHSLTLQFPDSFECHYAYANALSRTYRREQASAFITALVASDKWPDLRCQIMLRSLRFECAIRLKDANRAIEDFRSILQLASSRKSLAGFRKILFKRIASMGHVADSTIIFELSKLEDLHDGESEFLRVKSRELELLSQF